MAELQTWVVATSRRGLKISNGHVVSHDGVLVRSFRRERATLVLVAAFGFDPGRFNPFLELADATSPADQSGRRSPRIRHGAIVAGCVFYFGARGGQVAENAKRPRPPFVIRLGLILSRPSSPRALWIKLDSMGRSSLHATRAGRDVIVKCGSPEMSPTPSETGRARAPLGMARSPVQLQDDPNSQREIAAPFSSTSSRAVERHPLEIPRRTRPGFRVSRQYTIGSQRLEGQRASRAVAGERGGGRHLLYTLSYNLFYRHNWSCRSTWILWSTFWPASRGRSALSPARVPFRRRPRRSNVTPCSRRSSSP